MSDQPANNDQSASRRQQPTVAEPDEREYAYLTRHRLLHAFDWGALAMIGVSIGYGLLLFPVELSWGLIAVAIAGGWLIGSAVRHGAWRDALHGPARSLQLLAVLLAVVAWFGAFFVAYVAGQLLLPEPAAPLAERLSPAGFAEYLAGTYEFLHAIALAALAFMAWRSAR